MQNDLYKRLAHIEAIIDNLNNETEDVLMRQYKNACKMQNEEDAADIARKIRNLRLAKSDKEMTFDRIQLNLKNPLELINSLKKLANNEWSIYRQSLRDLPLQEGFPFNVIFPEIPFLENNELNK